MSDLPEIRATEPVGPVEAPLLLLGPSLGTSTKLWSEFIPVASERFRVVAWDLPGHGDSPGYSEPITVALLADALVPVIERLGGEAVHYAGISIGGGVGLELMVRHPELVASAAIICSGAKFGPVEFWQERARIALDEGMAQIVPASAKRWYAPGVQERRPERTEELLDDLRNVDRPSYAALCGAVATHDVEARLREIRVPVLAVWGQFDGEDPAASARYLSEHVADSREVGIAGSAHLPAVDRPEVFANVLMDFFGTKLR